MIRLKIRELLDQKGKTKYWLHNQINMDYNNLSRLMNNETDKIRFENIEKLCNILDCTPNDLFEIIPDDEVLFFMQDKHISFYQWEFFYGV